jgi:malate dehydrogenase
VAKLRAEEVQKCGVWLDAWLDGCVEGWLKKCARLPLSGMPAPAGFENSGREEAQMRKKVTLVGGGFVGATAAQRIADAGLADVVLTDILEGVPAGKGLDMLEAMPILKSDSHVQGISTHEGDYGATADSDIVVITAGFARKPGMSRDDLLRANSGVVKQVTEAVAKLSPKAILIVVTNPLDVMCQVAFRASGFSKNRVIGMAGVLDSARMRAFIAMEMGVSVENIHAFVLGGHGDDMVPLPRYSTVAGIPLPDLLPKERIDAIVQRTRKGGGEIVNLLKSGSAYYAPSAAVYEMVDSILRDRKKILPCAAYLEGEYGLKGIFMGVPVKLGAAGIEKIIEIKLTDEEKAALDKSAGSVKEMVQTLGL